MRLSRAAICNHTRVRRVGCVACTFTQHTTSPLRHLTTICTANAEHSILFYDRLVHWENKEIIQRQMRMLRNALRPGQVLKVDEVFKFATFVCAKCGDPDHCADTCEAAHTKSEQLPSTSTPHSPPPGADLL